MYQNPYDKPKIIKQDASRKFYDVSRPLYLETDVSGVSFVAELLQVRKGMNCEHDKVPDNVTLYSIIFAIKRLVSAEWHYSNIEWETLTILHGVKKFHH